jgi:hypothetical protein
MDYNIVSALSMTYSLQNRYQIATRSGLAELTSPQNVSDDRLKLAVYNAIRYLDDVTVLEADLGATYNAAATVIESVIFDDDQSGPKLLQADANDTE